MANAHTTYRELIDDAALLLRSESDTPRIDAEVLLQHVLQQPLSWLLAYGDSLASAEHVKAFYQLLEQRQQGHPIAYLIGSREFWSLNLRVTADVLIPRPDTETLVEQALQVLPANKPIAVLDLGTGSGAIALALIHVAMQCMRGKAVVAQQTGEVIRAALGRGEHQRLLNVGIAQDRVEQLVFVRHVVGKHEALFDVGF